MQKELGECGAGARALLRRRACLSGDGRRQKKGSNPEDGQRALPHDSSPDWVCQNHLTSQRKRVYHLSGSSQPLGAHFCSKKYKKRRLIKESGAFWPSGIKAASLSSQSKNDEDRLASTSTMAHPLPLVGPTTGTFWLEPLRMWFCATRR